MKWGQYYRDSKRDRTVREHFISTFFKYLLHAEGGCHSEEQALIHTRQVHIILDTLDENGSNLECLIRNDGIDIWDKFAAPKLQNKELTDNTIKVYLRSLQHFSKFIQKNLFYKKDLLTESEKQAISSLKDRLPDYRSTIHRRTASQTTTRKVEEAYKKIRPEDIRQFETSDLAKKAVKLLGEAIHNRLLTKNEFTVVRDFLIVTALYENGARPGPLENVKLSRFYEAEYTESTKCWTILVDEHKTTRHQGPAEIAMDDRLYGYTKLYAQHIRPCFVAAGEEYLFIKDDGEAFKKGTIGRRITEVFRQAGVRQDVRVTATNIRKLYSTSAAEMSPTKKRTINAHMKHKESTADSNYVLKVNTKRATTARQLMRSIIDDALTNPKPDDDQQPSTSAARDSDDEDDDIPLHYVFPRSATQTAPGQQVTTEDKHNRLTTDDKVVIVSVFKQEIEAGRLLTSHEVRTKMRGDLHLRAFVVHKDKVKKICDFVRHKTTLVRQAQHIIPEENQDDPNTIVTYSSGSRRQWDGNATMVIEKRFDKVPKMPNRSTILKMFEDDKVLSHILTNEGPDRCYEKVKNIYRKRALKK